MTATLTRREAPERAHVPARIGLGLVTRQSSGGGVAYVGRLLERALVELTGSAPWIAELAPARVGEVSVAERLHFAAQLFLGQASRAADGMLFNHVGVARAQRFIPGAVRLPYGVFVHGVEVWDPLLSPERRTTLREARVRIANSRYTARRLEQLHPGIGSVVPCPLALLPDDAPVQIARDTALVAAVRPRSVLVVGRMSAAERYKGHDELIESWPSVLAAVPEAQLVVAGHGDDAERLRRKARDAGIAEHVLFCGYVEDAPMRALLERVALFAMPSRGEGFGIVYLEAMRAGLPCIGSTDDAAGDVIADGRTGVLVAQQDRAALTRAIVALLRDESRRRELGEAGRRLYEMEFIFSRFVQRLGDVLASAFGGSTTGRDRCAE